MSDFEGVNVIYTRQVGRYLYEAYQPGGTSNVYVRKRLPGKLPTASGNKRFNTENLARNYIDRQTAPNKGLA